MLKMNVNEACNLAKRIERWKYDLMMLLRKDEYLYDIKETHQKSLSDKEAEDEIIENPIEKQYNISVSDICDILEKLTEEKVKVSEMIEATKSALTITVDGKTMTVDAATEYNKNIRDYITTLNCMCSNKDLKQKSLERGYRLDVEGKQTSYMYPCIKEYKTTFERKSIEAKKRELLKKADKISVEIDKARISSELELDTVLEPTDSVEDIIEKMVTRNTIEEPAVIEDMD